LSALFKKTNDFFQCRKTGPANLPSPSQKYTLKKVTSSIRLQNVFRRVSHGSTKQTESDSGKNKKDVPTGKIFGHPLERVPCGKEGVPKAMEVREFEKWIYLRVAVWEIDHGRFIPGPQPEHAFDQQ